MPKVTLQDIAKVCGVDISTVSRAMRSDPRVTPATRKKIETSARRLGYRPNLLARNLAGGSTRTIWLVLPSLDAPVDYRLVRHASHHANAKDYMLFTALHDCDTFGEQQGHAVAHYAQLIQRAGQGLADGAVILPRRYASDLEILRELVRHDFPMVFVDNYIEQLPVPVVTSANEEATRELVRRCIKAGAQGVILLFQEPNAVARTRLAAAQSELRKLGMPFVDINQVAAGWTPAEMPKALAIVGSSQYYLHQFAVHHAGHLQGKRLVFGVFDDWLGEPAPADQVIVAVQDCQTLAHRAVDRLIELIEGRRTAVGHQTIQIPVHDFRTIATAF